MDLDRLILRRADRAESSANRPICPSA